MQKYNGITLNLLATLYHETNFPFWVVGFFIYLGAQ